GEQGQLELVTGLLVRDQEVSLAGAAGAARDLSSFDHVHSEARASREVSDGGPDRSRTDDHQIRCRRGTRRAHNRKPAGNGSAGSSMYCAVPVTQARPVMVGMTAANDPTVVSPTSRPV